jgi:hypothetical protein
MMKRLLAAALITALAVVVLRRRAEYFEAAAEESLPLEDGEEGPALPPWAIEVGKKLLLHYARQYDLDPSYIERFFG